MTQLNESLSRRDVWRAAAMPIIATLIVFWQGSVQAGVTAQTLHDKLTHFLAFGGLAVLCVPWVRAIAARMVLSRVQQVAWCAGYATAIGGLLELWQALLPYRSAEWLDFAADAAGAGVASVALLLVPGVWGIERKTS